MDATLRTIVNQLIEKTKSGKTIWKQGNSANEYLLVLTEADISISSYTNRITATPFFECRVMNKQGDVILRENASVTTDSGNLLKTLYVLVRDAYTQKDFVIASVLSDLNQDGEVGESKLSDVPF